MFNDRHQDFIDEITTRIRKAGAGSYRINVVRDKTAIPFDFFVYHLLRHLQRCRFVL